MKGSGRAGVAELEDGLEELRAGLELAHEGRWMGIKKAPLLSPGSGA